MTRKSTVISDKNNLFNQKKREAIQKTLNLFNGFMRKTIADDPIRLRRIQQIFSKAEKEEKI